MKQVEKDLQDQLDNADREIREREDFPKREYRMTMEAMEHMTEAGERITELSEDDETAEPARDDQQIESETNGEGESAELPHGNADSDGHRRMNRTEPVTSRTTRNRDSWDSQRIQRGARTHEEKHPTRPMGTQTSLQKTVPDMQPGKTGKQIKPERKSKQSKSLQHPRRTSVFHVALGPPYNYESSELLTRSSFRLARESLNLADCHNSHRDERLPPETWAVTHTGADDERYKIRVGHQNIELSKNGGTYKLSRNGETYEFPSNDKPCQLWINGEDIKIKRNGETIELPRDGKQMSPEMNGQDQASQRAHLILLGGSTSDPSSESPRRSWEASKVSEASKASEPLFLPDWHISRPSQSNKRTPPNTFGSDTSAHSTVTSEDRGERVTYSIDDAIAEVVRHREQMGLPRRDGKRIKLSFDGEHTDHVVFERDGEWIKVPKNGKQTKPKGAGEETKSETNDEGIQPRTTDQETKPRTDDEQIMPETTDEQIKPGEPISPENDSGKIKRKTACSFMDEKVFHSISEKARGSHLAVFTHTTERSDGSETPQCNEFRREWNWKGQ
jgi:hypothetical protein